jgi:MerR family transcriptional regulator, copper efflux regulator
VSSYTIGEVARRSGFTASALRYYEDIGLVPAAARTEAGYRLYGEPTLSLLAFIARAKQLGCSLEEISDLVGIWDGERCGPVQRRFHQLVSGKIADTQRQVAELGAFGSQLQEAALHLGGEPIDGPCGDECACTLEPDAMGDRVAEWQSILEGALARTRTVDGALRVEFSDELDVAALAALVRAEQRCCAFYSFAITVDRRGVGLEVRVPDGAEELATSLFGAPA